jgi:hypothetical protein
VIGFNVYMWIWPSSTCTCPSRTCMCGSPVKLTVRCRLDRNERLLFLGAETQRSLLISLSIFKLNNKNIAKQIVL